jgi:hypothetical protein
MTTPQRPIPQAPLSTLFFGVLAGLAFWIVVGLIIAALVIYP